MQEQIMQNQIQVFEHCELGKLSVLSIDGKPYFPASECAGILGYAKPVNAIERHCRYTLKRGIPHPQSPGKQIEVNFIPEGDLYRLIIRSKLPEAERFEKWVFDEVLPSIRKYGGYIADNTLRQLIDNPEAAANFFHALTEERTKKEALENQINVLAPKARYHDIILQCTTPIPVSIIAKDYGMSAAAFNKLLHSFGIQYKVGGTWLLYRKLDDKGYTVSKTYHVIGRKSVIHTCWTQRGRKYIYEVLKQYGLLPQVERGEAPNV